MDLSTFTTTVGVSIFFSTFHTRFPVEMCPNVSVYTCLDTPPCQRNRYVISSPARGRVSWHPPPVTHSARWREEARRCLCTLNTTHMLTEGRSGATNTSIPSLTPAPLLPLRPLLSFPSSRIRIRNANRFPEGYWWLPIP